MRVMFKGSLVSLEGRGLGVGDVAPEFVLADKDLKDFSVGGAKPYVQLLSFVPSIDTGVCQAQTKAFNERSAGLKDVKVISVSLDLPFALARWCGSEGVNSVVAVSDFRGGGALSRAFGLIIGEGPIKGLCARAVFAIDRGGKIIYKEVVQEITDEPNYDAAVAALL